MPAVDVLDDTFVRADPARVRAATVARWVRWLPDLSLVVHEERGLKGVRWVARTAPGVRTPLAGTAEVWLEPVSVGTTAAGTVVHLYVRLDPPTGGTVDRRARQLPDRLRRRWKHGLHRSKDVLEGERQG